MQLQQIDYARALPNQKRRRAMRRVATGLAALLITILAIKSAPRAWRHVQILYWQQRAMTYSPPADQIVYDDDPAETSRVRASNPSVIAGDDGELFEFAAPWDRLYQLISPPGRRANATLFLHELTNSNGERRLVVVELRPWTTFTLDGKSYISWTLDCVILAPGTLSRYPHEDMPSLNREYPMGALSDGRSTRWYAGQADPHDPSHFTIRTVIGGKSATVDGWFRDDHVDFSDDFTLTSPAPSSSAISPPSAR